MKVEKIVDILGYPVTVCVEVECEVPHSVRVCWGTHSLTANSLQRLAERLKDGDLRRLPLETQAGILECVDELKVLA